MILEQLQTATKFHWLDEKHLLNRDVEGREWEPTHSPDTYLASCQRWLRHLQPVVPLSVPPNKERPVAYSIKKMAPQHPFGVHSILLSQFGSSAEIVMDNASIHTGGEADIEDLLWHAMQVLVVYLPTRSPPLAQPLEPTSTFWQDGSWSFRYREMAGPCDKAVLDLTCQVLDDLPFELIRRCPTLRILAVVASRLSRYHYINHKIPTYTILFLFSFPSLVIPKFKSSKVLFI
jgi:hypothetical protein